MQKLNPRFALNYRSHGEMRQSLAAALPGGGGGAAQKEEEKTKLKRSRLSPERMEDDTTRHLGASETRRYFFFICKKNREATRGPGDQDGDNPDITVMLCDLRQNYPLWSLFANPSS